MPTPDPEAAQHDDPSSPQSTLAEASNSSRAGKDDLTNNSPKVNANPDSATAEDLENDSKNLARSVSSGTASPDNYSPFKEEFERTGRISSATASPDICSPFKEEIDGIQEVYEIGSESEKSERDLQNAKRPRPRLSTSSSDGLYEDEVNLHIKVDEDDSKTTLMDYQGNHTWKASVFIGEGLHTLVVKLSEKRNA